jgi:hypothetical protein
VRSWTRRCTYSGTQARTDAEVNGNGSKNVRRPRLAAFKRSDMKRWRKVLVLGTALLDGVSPTSRKIAGLSAAISCQRRLTSRACRPFVTLGFRGAHGPLSTPTRSPSGKQAYPLKGPAYGSLVRQARETTIGTGTEGGLSHVDITGARAGGA